MSLYLGMFQAPEGKISVSFIHNGSSSTRTIPSPKKTHLSIDLPKISECLIVPITFLSRNDIKVTNKDKCSALMTLTCLGGD